MDIFVARQPVFTARKKIFGYELLFRAGLDNVFPDIDGTTATSGVLANTFFSFGLNNILGGKPGLINFTRDLLVRQTPLLFPKEHIIIEVLEDIEPEPEVISTLKTFRDKGFRIALDDFVYDKRFDGMIDLCHMIKFDLMATPLNTLAPLFSSKLSHRPITLLAEKVETYQEFEQAREMGFGLFQGYFFSKPEILSRRDMSASQVASLKLIGLAAAPDPDLAAIEDLIKKDISISFKLLKFINSAYFNRPSPVDTIKDAITFLGISELKKFINVVVVADLNPSKPNELVRSSVVRARMCELMGKVLKTRFSPDELFTMGLFSSMEAIMDMPMAQILDGITLSDRIKDALLGKDLQFKQLLDLIVSFDRGRWQHRRFQAGRDSALVQKLPGFYLDAVKMADAFFAMA